MVSNTNLHPPYDVENVFSSLAPKEPILGGFNKAEAADALGAINFVTQSEVCE